MKKQPRNAGTILIKGETFPYDVIVSLGTTRDELLTYIERNFVDALTEEDKEALQLTTNGHTLRLENNALILWTKYFPITAAQYGYLAHEIFHAADLMLRRAGLSLSDDSDETWAYQIDWLTKHIYSRFKLSA